MPRIALEGATTDGRTISRQWIEQMAANYDPAKYGARIWLEHIRGLLPDGPFSALGDVLKLSTKEGQGANAGKLELHADLKPLDNLVAMNKAGQKIYTSIEVDPDFAGTGQAYLMGLGVTDSPASLGTEALKFSIQSAAESKTKKVKAHERDVFSQPIEFNLDEPAPSDPPKPGGLKAKIAALFSRHNQQFADGDKALRDDVEASLIEFASHHESLTGKVNALPSAEEFQAFKTKLDEVYNALDSISDQPPRTHATGGNGSVVETDC